jgi:hypothetical protein
MQYFTLKGCASCSLKVKAKIVKVKTLSTFVVVFVFPENKSFFISFNLNICFVSFAGLVCEPVLVSRARASF